MPASARGRLAPQKNARPCIAPIGPLPTHEIQRHAIAAFTQAIESLWKNPAVQLRDSFAWLAIASAAPLAFRAT